MLIKGILDLYCNLLVFVKLIVWYGILVFIGLENNCIISVLLMYIYSFLLLENVKILLLEKLKVVCIVVVNLKREVNRWVKWLIYLMFVLVFIV